MQSNTGLLYQRSLEIILENQSASGAYVACPNFTVYRYCWFRDGSYIAYAMDLAGISESSARFHDWAARAINRRAETVSRAVEKAARAEVLGKGDFLHTRYTLDGEDDRGSPDPHGTGMMEWENFQLDGFGTWLWALEQHVRLSGCVLKDDWRAAAHLVATYLQALWKHPCYDCWEEFPDLIHPHTLACIYGGLKSYATLIETDEPAVLDEIQTFILHAGVNNNAFTKSIGRFGVDASLIGLCTPFRVVEPCDPQMVETISRIEADLVHGGVHRYSRDTYYGGGEWLLLAGWLGWYYIEIGKLDAATRLLNWMDKQSDMQFELPEQVPANLIDPAFYEPWIGKWGPIAKPLLWSHAMYVILSYQLHGIGKQQTH